MSDKFEIVEEHLSNGNTLRYKIINGTAYYEDTPDPVWSWLETARQRNARIRVFFGDAKTGRDWGEEYDVVGTVGRSWGPIKIPLMISNSRSTGGGALLCNCIVRLYVDGREVYRHKKYNQPKYTIGKPQLSDRPGRVDMKDDGYTTGVYADGDNVANFKSEKSARNYVDFMTGKRMCK